MKSKLCILIMSVAILFSTGLEAKAMAHTNAPAVAESVCLDNVGVTKCWLGTCGHKSKTYSYPSYTKGSTSTSYYYTGFYLDPGVTQTVTFSKTVSQSISIGAGVDGEVAKASLGFTGSTSKTLSVSQSIKNNTSKRKYAHLGVEFQNRSNTVTIKERTYNPAWHVTAINENCKFKTSTSKQSCKVATGCGLSLRASK